MHKKLKEDQFSKPNLISYYVRTKHYGNKGPGFNGFKMEIEIQSSSTFGQVTEDEKNTIIELHQESKNLTVQQEIK